MRSTRLLFRALCARLVFVSGAPGALFVFTALCAFILPAVVHGAAARSADISTRNLKVSDFPRWQKLAPDVYAYEGLHSPDKDGTIVNTVSLIVITADGVLVVDGQGDIQQTQLMIDNIGKLTTQPIRTVVIASDHGDHVGGNAAFKRAYPQVVFLSSPASHKTLEKNTALSMLTGPTQAIGDRKTLRMGKTDIEIMNLGRAHTGGDLVVYLPQDKVLFLGEVYLREVFPAMRSAYPTEWLATIDKARAMKADWVVPGHGFVDTAADMKRDLEESRKALVYVIGEAKRLRQAGYACESAANCPAAEHANWGPYASWAMRTSQAPVAIARVYSEIDGALPKAP